MSDIWGSFKNLLNLNAKKIYIDNLGFRLHYKITTVILVAFGILVTSRQYFGDPIDCITTDDYIKPIIDQYCWVHGTFTYRQPTTDDQLNNQRFSGKELSRDFQIFPGLIKGEEPPKDYASYYQWVWIVLLIQAACFYFPHWIWKTWEGGRIKTLVNDLNSHVLADEVKTKHKSTIVTYFKPGRGVHLTYAGKYVLCEILCFLNIIIQILLTEKFIGDQFINYGLNVFKSTENPNYASDLKVFPTVTFCKVPVCGTICHNPILREGFCILPINVLNQKIYRFLWFWFIFLAVTSGIVILYRAIVTFSPTIRKWRLRSISKSIDEDDLERVISKADFGDWFFLYELGRNMNPIYFAELIKELSGSIGKDGSYKDQLLPY